MEIVGPVLGTGAVIAFVVAGIVMVRWLTSKIPQPASRVRDEGVQAQLDQLNQRIAELEERVDFAERLLAKQREAARLGQG
jgi:hypothetical protein